MVWWKLIINNDNILENNNFLLGSKNNNIFEINDNIFDDNNYILEDDDDYNNPFNFKFSLKKINKKYIIENLINEIKKYY